MMNMEWNPDDAEAAAKRAEEDRRIGPDWDSVKAGSLRTFANTRRCLLDLEKRVAALEAALKMALTP